MTETRIWLEARRRELARRTAGAGALLTAGLVLVALAAGIGLARLGLYQHLPLTVLVAWLAVPCAVACGIVWWRRRGRGLGWASLAAAVERGGGQRRGLVEGIAAWDGEHGSAALARVADARVATWLANSGASALSEVRDRSRREVRSGAALFVAGLVVFAGAGPAAGEAAAFWHPVEMLARARRPVELSVDRTDVRRGEYVTASIRAPGRATAELWLRAPGEPWRSEPLALDTAGRATMTLGPLDSDRFVRAVTGRRASETVHVRVALPALLTRLELSARFPAYLERADEPLAPGEGPVLLPVGTRVLTRGAATVELAGASWRTRGTAVPLEVDDDSFRGTLTVAESGRWELEVVPHAGGVMDESPAVLEILAVPDSAPTVSVPVPGTDTTVHLSLRQALLIDARDDHRITRVELESWRVSRYGEVGEPLVEEVPLPAGGAERAVLSWLLDLSERGFLPGDTAHFLVRARDSRPTPQVGESRVFTLRLPAMAELREATRRAGRRIGAEADSLVREQTELARQLEDLAAERERGLQTEAPGARGEDQLPFSSVERAQELLQGERDVVERARSLRERMNELADAAWQAGLTDPEFQQQLRHIQDLLERAIDEELEARLDALRQALERLDAEGTRDALRELARQAAELREELRRGRELFERAAVEGDLTSLSRDADELAAEQQQWNERAEQGVDSSVAERESELARRADSLAAELERLEARIDSIAPEMPLEGAARRADQAARRMQQAAGQARRGDAEGAQESGEAASEALDPLSEVLEQERDELREAWRQEVMQQLDRALVETAQLAREQEDLTRRLALGEAGTDVRGAQAANRDGVDRVIERLQGAAGKNALVSPRLAAALGLAKLKMGEALDQVQRANPNTREGERLSGEAQDALTSVIYALLQAQGQVSGSQSGSGLQEAMEQLAELAEQQGELSGQSSGMLSQMPAGGDRLMEELMALAREQRALAQELERMAAEGDVSGTDELADEADELADRLEAGRLDRDLVERQEQLFRRLLDAGRSLESDEEDETRERVSQAADPTLVRLPGATEAPALQQRYPYPTWEELRRLTPEERRLILDYFQRLNDAPR